MVKNVDGDSDSVHLPKFLGEPHSYSCVSTSSQLQKVWVLISRKLQRVWEDKLRENKCVVVAGKGVQAKSFNQKLQNKSVGREETFLQTFLINHIE